MPADGYRDEWPIAPGPTRSDHAAMKRIAAGPLWFLAGWFLGSVAAFAFGLGPLVAPVAGVVLAGAVVADPLHLIWRTRTERTKAIARLTAVTDDGAD